VGEKKKKTAPRVKRNTHGEEVSREKGGPWSSETTGVKKGKQKAVQSFSGGGAGQAMPLVGEKRLRTVAGQPVKKKKGENIGKGHSELPRGKGGFCFDRRSNQKHKRKKESQCTAKREEPKETSELAAEKTLLSG